jgi:hypothetical protein
VSQPANATVTVGQTATFDINNGGTPACPVTIQWQVSTNGGTTFANIGGETNGILSVVTTSVSQSGTEYRAVLTNGDGSTIGNAATLTVNPGAPRGTSAMWVPLACNLGTVPVHVGALVTANLPASVTPGQTFQISDGNVELDIPATAQNSLAPAFGAPDMAEGVVTDLEAALSGASAGFQNADTTRTGNGAGTWGPDVGGTSSDPNVGTASQVNLVAATQLPNALGSGSDPLVNGPSPLQAFPNFPEAPLMGAWSYGPVSITGNGSATTDEFTAIPGTGGGAAVDAGTPDPVAIGPLTVTAAAGGTVTITLGLSGKTVGFGNLNLPYVMSTDQFFFETDDSQGLLGQWSADVGIQCGVDTSPQAVPSPILNYVSVAQGFRIPVVAPTPAVSGVTPPSGSAAGGTTITITGTGFSSGDTVKVGATPATAVAVVSPTQITAVTPAGSVGGSVDVTVTDPGGSTSALSSRDLFTYNLIPCTPPAITTQPANATVTVGQTASFSVAATTPTSCSAPTFQWQVSTDGGITFSNIGGATSATLTVSSTTLAESGSRYRAVATNGAGSTTSNAATLTVNPLPNSPVITTVSPSSGGPFSLVLIMGQHLNGATQVTFGGRPTLFLGIGSQFVIARAPLGPRGTVAVLVRTRVATSTATTADRFTYTR